MLAIIISCPEWTLSYAVPTIKAPSSSVKRWKGSGLWGEKRMKICFFSRQRLYFLPHKIFWFKCVSQFCIFIWHLNNHVSFSRQGKGIIKKIEISNIGIYYTDDCSQSQRSLTDNIDQFNLPFCILHQNLSIQSRKWPSLFPFKIATLRKRAKVGSSC